MTQTNQLTAENATKSVECNLTHGGTRHLTRLGKHYQCDGCGNVHSLAEVMEALAGPVTGYTGRDGVAKVRS